MRIVHAAGEIFPYVKTGGLADALHGLSRALVRMGNEVSVFVPAYRSLQEHPDYARAERVLSLHVPMGGMHYAGEVRRLKLAPGLDLYAVERDEFFDRRHPYGRGDSDYDDNDLRFIFFNRAITQSLRLLDLKADVVHAHDWQTGLLPLFVREEEQRTGATVALRTVFTFHNLAFQGLFPRRSFQLTGLPEELWQPDGVEFYGQLSMIKGGILFADRVTTVSPTYFAEVQTPELGCGLDGALRSRLGEFTAVLNGCDDDVWDPGRDMCLPLPYQDNNPGAGKRAARRALLQRSGWSAETKGPVFGFVGRLTEQKGAHLLPDLFPFFKEHGALFVVLGRGSPDMQQRLLQAQRGYEKSVALALENDEAWSHLLMAGADFFLMPSTREPCGLTQMYALRYGAVPLCGRVGGLVDTVSDLDADPRSGTGFLFSPDRDGVRGALLRALRLHEDKPRLEAAIQRGMARRFSWDDSARRYEQLYTDDLEY